MQVYYDVKDDKIILVTTYPHIPVYIYSDGKQMNGSDTPPTKQKDLFYIGEFFNGDVNEME